MEQKQQMVRLNAGEYIRRKLDETMTEVIEKQLILIIAPSGYGKTTFVRQYFSKRPALFHIWFPLQRDETDENWMWRRMCQKASEYSTEIFERISQVELPESEQEISYVIKILNRYMTRPVYLIVDDYQECGSALLNRLLEAVVKDAAWLHIILISRTYPDIPYEEMFLKGYGVTLNQRNLTLSKEETAEIFKENQIVLEDTELAQLYEYTDGWISAVYLSLYEYKKRGGFGCFLGVNHLLKTAIFDKLSPAMKEFYMKVSLFDWFDRNGAAYVTEQEISEGMLQESQEQFGFLYFDSKTNSYQMHTLLRTVAEAELGRSEIDVTRLYHRAGEWCEKRGTAITAVRYYRKAKDWEKIAQLYAGEHGKSMIEQAPELFEEILDAILPDIWKDNLMALIYYLYYLAMKERAQKVRPLYEQTVEKIAGSKRWSADPNIQGEMQIIQAALQFNDLGKMNGSLRKACSFLGYQTSAILGDSLLTYGTVCMTALYCKESGQLSEVIAQEKEYAKYYMQLTRGGQEGWDDFFDAEYALLTGKIDKAYQLARQVCEQNAIRKQTCIVISCYYIMLRCLLYRGERTAFEKKMREMNEQLETVTNPILVADMELARGYLYACLGEREKMPDWLRDFKLENCSRTIRNIRGGCMTYGRLLCAEKNWGMLDLVADQMIVPYETTVHIQSLTVGYLYKAIAKYYLGQEKIAVEYLKKAISLAKPDEVRVSFWENGKELEPIMKQMGEDPFIGSVMPYVKQFEKGRNVFRNEKTEEKPILTEREAELMEYVKEGYRNVQIAEQMHIAQVTVEKNLTSIYRKLQVKNRTAAIKKLKEMEEL